MSKTIMELINPYTEKGDVKFVVQYILQVLNPEVMVNITMVPGNVRINATYLKNK